jgi:aspartate/methionine/tyrosine aminotransferase
MFSSRLSESIEPNALTRAIGARRAAGGTWLDLTETNPTTVGLDYPADVLAPLADARARRYEPEPLGMGVAREAIACDYARRGRVVAPEHVVVTASTSEAYSLLFKLLCNPGDAVLVPQPSYPLFELLAGLEAVALRPYRLLEHDAWSIDRASLTEAMAPNVRAVLVVSPNNPTGSMLRRDDLAWLADTCARQRIALIADEVFVDYPLAARAEAVAIAGDEPALTFALGGLSKSAGLPQVKLGWMAVGGPPALVTAALARLELICDTFLSVSTPVQWAAPALIDHGATIRAAIHARVRGNLAKLRETLAAHPALTLLAPEAGWSAVWQVPATEPEEALVLRLFNTAGVLVHPGYFLDFAREAFLVTSLLPAPTIFDEALDRLMHALPGGAR